MELETEIKASFKAMNANFEKTLRMVLNEVDMKKGLKLKDRQLEEKKKKKKL